MLKGLKRIKIYQKLPPFGKFVTEVLIFAAANIFQLNQVFITDSRTGFFLSPQKTRVKPQKQPLDLFSKKKLLLKFLQVS